MAEAGGPSLYNFDADVDRPKPITSPRSLLAMKKTGVTQEMICRIPYEDFKNGAVLPGWVRDTEQCEEWQWQMKYQAMEERVRLRSLEKARKEYDRICNGGDLNTSVNMSMMNSTMNTSGGAVDQEADQSRLVEMEKKRLAKFEKKMADEIKQKVQFQMQTKAIEEKNAAKQRAMEQKEYERKLEVERRRREEAERARQRAAEKEQRAAEDEARKRQELAEKEVREREFAQRKAQEEAIKKAKFAEETARKQAKKDARRREAEEKMRQERLANEERQLEMQRKEAELMRHRELQQRRQKEESERKRLQQEARAAEKKAESERKLEADKERFLANEQKVQDRLDRFEYEKQVKKMNNRMKAEQKREEIMAAVSRMEEHEEQKREKQLSKDRELDARMRDLDRQKRVKEVQQKRQSMERREHIEYAIANANNKLEARKQHILDEQRRKEQGLRNATAAKQLQINQHKTRQTIKAQVNDFNVNRVRKQQEFYRESVMADLMQKEARVQDMMGQKAALHENRLRMQRNMAKQKMEIDDVMERLRKGKFIDRSNMAPHIQAILESADAAAAAAAAGEGNQSAKTSAAPTPQKKELRRTQSAGGVGMNRPAQRDFGPAPGTAQGMGNRGSSTKSLGPPVASRPPRSKPMKYAEDKGFSARSIVEQYSANAVAPLTAEQQARLAELTDPAEKVRLTNIFQAQNSK